MVKELGFLEEHLCEVVDSGEHLLERLLGEEAKPEAEPLAPGGAPTPDAVTD